MRIWVGQYNGAFERLQWYVGVRRKERLKICWMSLEWNPISEGLPTMIREMMLLIGHHTALFFCHSQHKGPTKKRSPKDGRRLCLEYRLYVAGNSVASNRIEHNTCQDCSSPFWLPRGETSWNLSKERYRRANMPAGSLLPMYLKATMYQSCLLLSGLFLLSFLLASHADWLYLRYNLHFRNRQTSERDVLAID